MVSSAGAEAKTDASEEVLVAEDRVAGAEAQTDAEDRVADGGPHDQHAMVVVVVHRWWWWCG